MMFFAEYNPLRCGKEKEKAFSNQLSAFSQDGLPQRTQRPLRVEFRTSMIRALTTAQRRPSIFAPFAERPEQAHAPPRLSFFD
jgi:hypothetical protein